jgi:hypothetical protein
MLRSLFISAAIAVAPVVVFTAAPVSAQAPSGQKCPDTAAKQARRSMFGSLLGSIGGSVLGRVGAPGEVVAAALPAASYLSDELLKMLDCKEQQQASKATDEAIRGGVGTEVSWKSETRANVSGTSKVTGQDQLADGTQCLTVSDVVIVDGEETTVPKKMCKAKGGNGYVRV